ncbi:MAG TPA: hypothetical protein DC049_16825, partial [Spirochaetia bacterium]|nr:hypothetical protein [Spirochaetia bacterium]
LLNALAASARRHNKKFKILAEYPYKKETVRQAAEAGLFISIGGDGTVLSAVPLITAAGAPLLPVNFGKLGFISSVSESSAVHILEAFLSGRTADYKTENRRLLEAGFCGKRFLALNDAVLSRGSCPRLLRFTVSISGISITEVRADGVIISTATGSTAYNLAASGPILHPQVPALILNLISPHSLTFKPIIFPENETIQIKVSDLPEKHRAIIDIDGHLESALKNNGDMRVRLTDQKISVLKPSEENYYLVLKEKLKWGV